MRQQIPGLDLSRLGSWLDAKAPETGAGELWAEVITGGKSNLTYSVRRDGWRGVVRRPPLGHVLATAHDMGREFRVMRALRDTPVPVPPLVAQCSDPDVIGAPFYVMGFVEGLAYRTADELDTLGKERTTAICEGLLDTLVALHQLDPESVGLADFGHPRGYLARQVSRWKKQMDASRSRDLPQADELYRALAAATPDTSRVGIVHGDYRLDNLLIDSADRVAAVVDWEMATIGDPLSDLALFLVYQRLSASAATGIVGDAPLAAGYLSEPQIVDRYASGIGDDLPSLGFHIALASFKVASIVEGIHFRHLQGQTVGTGFDGIGDAVAPLLEAGIAAIKELS
jgi:aminoglycoside phosphotransferase (APT) family kinase protein